MNETGPDDFDHLVLVSQAGNSEDYELLQEKFPQATISGICASGVLPIDFFSRVKKHTNQRACIVFPNPRKNGFSIWYWWSLIIALFVKASACYFFLRSGHLRPVKQILFRTLLPMGPLMSLLHIVSMPSYLVREIIPKLLLAGDRANDEIVGYGRGRAAGGQVYWLTLANEARRFGTFGMASDLYMGMPLSLHTWPLAVGVLAWIGYRRYLALSVLLFVAGLAWIFWAVGAPLMVIFVPLLLVSNYYLFNIVAGTWEILSWGLFLVSLASLVSGYSVVAGFLMALVVLGHPGVGMLSALLLLGLVFVNYLSPVELIIAGVTGGACAVWWIWPYLKAGKKLGRERILAETWNSPRVWNSRAIYQFSIYSLFALAAAYQGGWSTWHLVHLLPLGILYWNTKIKWIFSNYTVFNFMMVVGALQIALQPDVVTVVTYLLVIFTPANFMWPGDCKGFGLDLTPLYLGEKRRILEELFGPLKPGRIALELGTNRAHPGWSIVAPVGYVASTMDMELFNSGYTEIGDYDVYNKVARYLHDGVSFQDFEQACRIGGIRWVVATTESYKRCLESWGCTKVDETEPMDISDWPNASEVSLTVYEVPWETSIIAPVVPVSVERNRVTFEPVSGETYRLAFTYFEGWRAFQAGKEIYISDANPGMEVKSIADSPIEFRYSLMHYWHKSIARILCQEN